MEQIKKIGVAIAGCGAITRTRHALEYSKNNDAIIKGFYDYDKCRAEELVGIYGGKVYASFEELIADESVQAVSVCTPNFLHAENTIAALKAGKDVLCEKPMAPTVEQAQSMIAAQKETGKILMLGHNQRLVCTHIKARKILQEGTIGKVLYIQTNFKHAGPEGWSVDKGASWFFDKSKAKFGVLGDLGSHKIDLVRYLLDDEIERVFSALTTLDKCMPDGKLIGLDDNAACLFTMRSGIPGFMHVSWTNYGHEDNSTIIYGTDGTMKIFASELDDIVIDSRDGTSSCYRVGAISTNRNQMNSGIIDAFITSVKERTEPLVSGLDGRNTLACLEAAGKSSESGTWQKVDLG
ncbi:MAG: Gfo/Idh/MocA family protein [Mobilitalea sp.]